MKIFGIILLLCGLALTLFTNSNNINNKQKDYHSLMNNVGEVANPVNYTIASGSVMIMAGAVMFVTGRRRHLKRTH